MNETLSAVLPLKISGRHYGDNLRRCDLLFGTMRHFRLASLFKEVLIIVPGNEMAIISQQAEAWREFAIRVVAEDDFLGVFSEYTKIHQVRPWHRQQIIKLACARLITTPYFVTLDPDVLALREFVYADLIQDGRAILEPEPRTVHADWWRASASLLGCDPGLDRPGMSVTPALLSRDICLAMMERLQVRHGREWYRVLLENYAINWTEYTLYYLTAEILGQLDEVHFVPDTDEPHLMAPYRVWVPSEANDSNIAKLFSLPQRDFFSVIQSSAGVSAAEIASLIAPYIPITLSAPMAVTATRSDRRRELAGAAIRKVMNALGWMKQTR